MTSITFEQVQQLADRLSPTDKARLIDLLRAQLAEGSTSTETAESRLGQQLRAIRADIVASGAPLLDRASLAAELAKRRSER